jgi:phage head maturation protease
MPNPESSDELLTFEGIAPDIEVRSESKREVGIRFMKWGEIGRTEEGLETFDPGAFDDNKPEDIVLRMEHEGPPAGRGIALERDQIGQIGVFKVAPTARGDELMTLAKEGYYRGASPMFRRDNHVTTYERTKDGQRLARRKKVDTREVSLTWRPTYQGTEVLFARSEVEEAQVAEETYTPAGEKAPAPAGSFSADDRTIEQMRQFAREASDGATSPLLERIVALEARSQVETGAELPDPNADDGRPAPKRGEWMKAALTLMDGGDLPAYERRTLADNISDDNPGFVPVAYSNELIGVIDPQRPFMQSTRRIEMPAAGLQLSYPRITQRPTVGEQTVEKTEVSSRKVTTDQITADVRTFAGAGDISLQLLRRSAPQFLDAYLELLGEAYAQTVENAAVDAILAAGVTAGSGTFNPANAEFGEAFENGAAVGRTLIPDTMWMSTTAMVEFINAKATTTNQPLYPGLAGISGLNGGASGGPNPMILNPVWTPALDDETTDVLIGPSRGFAWAEEGTFTLTVDVPGRLGRDVALGGFVVFVPLYPAAFTRYVVAT